MIYIRCYLCIAGTDVDNVDFSEITSVVGFPPTRTHRGGKQRYPFLVPASSWAYDVVEMMTTDSSDPAYFIPSVIPPLEALRARFASREDVIREYCRDHDLSVSVNIVVESEDSEMPSLELSAEFVGFLARLGGSVYFDLYLNMGTL